MTRPLVSALMVTQPGREDLAVAAARDFSRQTWPEKELVVVSDGPRAHHEALGQRLFDCLGPCRWTLIWVDTAGTPLGVLRNRAVAAAVGDYCIQWDDDDRYHADRIATQAGPLAADPTLVASCYTDQLYYFRARRQLYWVDWHNRRPTYRSVKIPGTVCFNRHRASGHVRYPESGPAARRGEDGAFLERLLALGDCREVSGRGCHYFRQYHGRNTWGLTRFLGNARWLSKPAAELYSRRAELEEALRTQGYAAGPVEVHGRAGPLYTIGVGEPAA